MKIEKEMLENVLEVLNNADDLKPVIDRSIKVLEGFAAQIEPTLKKLNQYMITNRVESVDYYMRNHFTREQAILMTLDDSGRIKDMLGGMNKKSKS